MIWIQKYYRQILLGFTLIIILLLTLFPFLSVNEWFAIQLPLPNFFGNYISFSPTPSADMLADLPIPQQDDWVDYGEILSSGLPGQWDLYLYGGMAGSVVKKDGIYYLYYQGSSGYDSLGDTVTERAIGVATSSDGINFTKFEGNPIITWSPTGNGEEGAVSAGATLVDDQVFMYYGANTEQNSTKINSDVRLAISEDALEFEDKGVVLSFRDSNVWGSGDELSPIIAFQENGHWFVYYLPNGVLQRHKLGVARGSAPDRFTQTAEAQSGFQGITAWGMGGYARISPDTYVLFINDLDGRTTEARIISTTNPEKLSAPVETYKFEDYLMSTVFLDQERRTWFMYYLDADESLIPEEARYGVKLAPAGPPDETPPTTPENIRVGDSSGQIIVTWDPAIDKDTGIAQYRIYSNGELLSTAKGEVFESDASIDPEDRISITAVNYHGTESLPSDSVTLGQRSLKNSGNPEKECREKDHQ